MSLYTVTAKKLTGKTRQLWWYKAGYTFFKVCKQQTICSETHQCPAATPLFCNKWTHTLMALQYIPVIVPWHCAMTANHQFTCQQNDLAVYDCQKLPQWQCIFLLLYRFPHLISPHVSTRTPMSSQTSFPVKISNPTLPIFHSSASTHMDQCLHAGSQLLATCDWITELD